ncbi:unnamed protein product [Acidithrix sp. C25]|nr:unnamed protein product [Acidithrix sp. C25]
MASAFDLGVDQIILSTPGVLLPLFVVTNLAASALLLNE